MKKFNIVLLTVLLMLLHMTAVSAFAGEFHLFDKGKRLSDADFAEVTERLQETADNTHLNVIVILGNEQLSDITIESLTNETYDQLFSEGSDGVCFYLDLSGAEHPYDYISTSGMAQFYYTNSNTNNRIDQMHYAIDKYLYPIGNEDVSGALNAFADQLENYYEIGIPDNYYVYDDLYHQYYHVEDGEIITTSRKPYHDVERLFLGGIMGLLIGIMISAIVKGAVKLKYRFIYELSPVNYINKKSVHYIQQTDTFLRERTTKTHISSDSGGRSGGSHHHSGGHSHGGHGGGGHHR
ncbi:MAG: TPM domain-containing protein [Oscillospiraceae bacterium]|nr:TPM domain-containing protein [Oscillospiraceae bacterium]